MAETDTRLETLEDEVKVLKGEVKRTLVDLRALLMREDSPLGEAAVAKRMAMQNAIPVQVNEAPPIPAPVAVAPPPAPVIAEPPPPAPVAVAPPPAPPPGPGPGPQNVMPQGMPGPGPSPPPQAMPIPQAFAPPGAPPADNSSALARQDRLMAEQERRMTDQERKMSQLGAFAPPGGPPADNLSALAQQERMMAEQERRIAEQERKIAERERKMAESENDDEPPRSKKPRKPARIDEDELDEVPNDLEYERAEENRPRLSRKQNLEDPVPGVIVNLEEEDEDAFDEDEPVKPSAKKRSPMTSPRVMAEEEDEDEEDDDDVFEEDEPDDEPEEDDSEEDDPVNVSPPPSHKGRSKSAKVDRRVDRKVGLIKHGAEEEVVHGDNKSDSQGKSERVTSIYDEYRELLEETKQAHTLEDEPVGPPLDVNLMANLVYWASLAKQRVGEQQLNDILHLYIQSGHSRPELQDLLLHICKMVDVESAEVEQNGSDWVDLLFHLHGILTGGFPVIKIPYVRLPAQEDA